MFVNYHFFELDKSIDEFSALSGLENGLLRAATQHGLALSRTQGHVRGWIKPTITVYRFLSPHNHAWCDFVFETPSSITILMLFIETPFQGAFFNLKNFLMKRVAATLFSVGVTQIGGVASCDSYPVRQARDWRGMPAKHGNGTKLTRLYEVLGFEVNPLTCDAVLRAPANQTWG